MAAKVGLDVGYSTHSKNLFSTGYKGQICVKPTCTCYYKACLHNTKLHLSKKLILIFNVDTCFLIYSATSFFDLPMSNHIGWIQLTAPHITQSFFSPKNNLWFYTTFNCSNAINLLCGLTFWPTHVKTHMVNSANSPTHNTKLNFWEKKHCLILYIF